MAFDRKPADSGKIWGLFGIFLMIEEEYFREKSLPVPTDSFLKSRVLILVERLSSLSTVPIGLHHDFNKVIK